MGIADWPLQDRPREKLLARGSGNLTDAELLAIFINTGVKGKTALDLARDLLAEFGSLSVILSASCEALAQQPGIGTGKYVLFQAMQELSRRCMLEKLTSKDILNSSAATRDYLRARFRFYKSEVFSCLYLSNQHHIVKLDELFRGTIDGAVVYPREVVRRCIEYNAAAVIFAHNHPSGVAEPSQADINITRRLMRALETIDVRVLDHLVVGDADVVSFAERGLL